MPVNLFRTLILGSIICYSIAFPTNTEDKSPFSRSGQHSIKADRILGMKNALMDHLLNRTNEEKRRKKRDNTGAIDVKAIQTTINDHKTMIEDNRIMIYNIINNSINTNNITEAITNHYVGAPMWNSWRDSALIFVTIFTVFQIIHFCTSNVKLRPCDYIMSRILQRYDTRPSKTEQLFIPPLAIDNGVNRSYSKRSQHPSTTQQTFVNSIEADYAEIQQNRGVTK